jgi:hypothetical protein
MVAQRNGWMGHSPLGQTRDNPFQRAKPQLLREL